MALEEDIKDTLKSIESEKNEGKQRMLQSVFHNNLEHIKTVKAGRLFRNIIDSMKIVDRKFFVGKENEDVCYVDNPLPIGHAQTISQPTTVARMLLLSELEPNLNVLEIGSGSGWNASLIADLVKPGKVISTERIKELQENAKNNFDKFSEKTKLKLNVEFLHTDTFNKKSKVWENKYDRIITTAGASYNLFNKMSELGTNLLKDNGLMLYPTNESVSGGALELWKKQKNKVSKIKRDEGYVFVPLLEGE